MLRAPLVALVVAGCADPTVEVSFALPDAYRELVGPVVLDVLAPPAAEPFGCDELAFGDIAPETAALALVQTVGVRGRDHAPLSGIPRTGRKLFVARGLDGADNAVVAACAELGDIEEDVAVELVGEPTALVASGPTAVSDPLPERLRLAVTDVTGHPLPRIPVRWTTLGPGELLVDGDGASGSDGVVEIEPATSPLPGPIGVDIQVRWQSTQTARVIGFTPAAPWFTADLPGEAGDRGLLATEVLYRVGRIGPDGEMGVAALGPTTDEAIGRRVLIAWYDGDGFRTATSPLLPGVQAIGLIAAGGRDRVVAASGTAWIEIAPTGAVEIAPPPHPGAGARRLLPLDRPDTPCQEGWSAAAALVSYVDGALVAVDATGQPIASPFVSQSPSGRAIASGCAAGIDGKVHRVVAFAETGSALILLAAMDGMRQGGLPVLAGGVGFSPALGAAAPGLLAVELAVDGLAIVRYRLVPVAAAGLETEAVERVDTLSFALSTVGGDLDADGNLDLAAVLPFQTGEDAAGARVQIALGKEHLGQRLVGLSPELPADAARLLIADFDGNGHDDLVVATPLAFSIFDSSRTD